MKIFLNIMIAITYIGLASAQGNCKEDPNNPRSKAAQRAMTHNCLLDLIDKQSLMIKSMLVEIKSLKNDIAEGIAEVSKNQAAEIDIAVRKFSTAFSKKLVLEYSDKAFSNVREIAVVPDSHNSFCALSYVDDDSPLGACNVLYEQGADRWIYSTGDDIGGNTCRVSCIKIKLEDELGIINERFE